MTFVFRQLASTYNYSVADDQHLSSSIDEEP